MKNNIYFSGRFLFEFCIIIVFLKTFLIVFHTRVNCWLFAGVWMSLILQWEVSSSLQDSSQYSDRFYDLNNVVISTVSRCPLISKSSSPCTNPLVAVPSAPITIGITITFMFHSFSDLSHGLGTYLSFRFLSVLPCGQLERQSLLSGRFSSFLLIFTGSGRLVEIRWFIHISKPHWSYRVAFSWMDSELCIYRLFVGSNLNFLQNS